MKLHFHLPYGTAWGETLHAVLLCQDAAGCSQETDAELSTPDGRVWTGQAEISLQGKALLTYHYEVRRDGAVLRREWQAVPRLFYLNPDARDYFFNDSWRDLPAESWLYSSALTEGVYPRPKTDTPEPVFSQTLILRAAAPRLTDKQRLYVCGESAALGAWNPQKAVVLAEMNVNEWCVSLNVNDLLFPSEYKFLAKNADGSQVVWEEGPNRRLTRPILSNGQVWVEQEAAPVIAYRPFKGAGVVLPVFSLRSEDDAGAGDFGDLKKLADWAAQTGQRVIQLLPVNDTGLTGTWTDSYPYNSISVYAFHPFYADLRTLPPMSKKDSQAFEKERRRLNALPHVDYEAVIRLKTERLKKAFKKEGKQVLTSPEFQTFFNENRLWLPAYAMFSVLRDRYGTADFNRWPRYSRFTREDLEKFCAAKGKNADAVAFYYYVQYLLHVQLLEASRYARSKGVVLKGDIPIGVSPHSVEAWTESTYFNLNAQAGAPPDDFSATGQNWGFPTYNWDVMARDGYQWWKRRFTQMARYFDAYRIDHVLGFFRIWEIPAHSVQGLLGQFVPALPLTREEIAEYGLAFKDSFLRPAISNQLLDDVFNIDAQTVKETFLFPLPDGQYAFKPEYDTQRKLEAALAGKKNAYLLEGLYALVSNVLFVPDRQQPGHFHPRISALKDRAFAALSAPEQAAYTRLYNDYFYRRHNAFWKDEALKKLPALTQATRMLCCAEDLGMIPHSVPDVMHRLQMLSLEIQRMPKQPGETFADTRRYPYLSVAAISTHDMATLRGWWKETPALTERFYREVLGGQGAAPRDAGTSLCEAVINMHLQSPSMLCLLSFQDWTSMDETLRAADPDAERINVPANPRHYWRYRMHLTLEDLLNQTDFNRKINRLVTQSGR